MVNIRQRSANSNFDSLWFDRTGKRSKLERRLFQLQTLWLYPPEDCRKPILEQRYTAIKLISWFIYFWGLNRLTLALASVLWLASVDFWGASFYCAIIILINTVETTISCHKFKNVKTTTKYNNSWYLFSLHQGWQYGTVRYAVVQIFVEHWGG